MHFLFFKGTLCAVVEKDIPKIGFILHMDIESTTIAFVTDPEYFFKTKKGTMRSFFNHVRNITHVSVMSGDAEIFVLNQLNRVAPFPSEHFSFMNTISQHDGCINANPLGPDKFSFRDSMHEDKLYRFAINKFHKIAKIDDTKADVKSDNKV